MPVFLKVRDTQGHGFLSWCSSCGLFLVSTLELIRSQSRSKDQFLTHLKGCPVILVHSADFGQLCRYLLGWSWMNILFEKWLVVLIHCCGMKVQDLTHYQSCLATSYLLACSPEHGSWIFGTSGRLEAYIEARIHEDNPMETPSGGSCLLRFSPCSRNLLPFRRVHLSDELHVLLDLLELFLFSSRRDFSFAPLGGEGGTWGPWSQKPTEAGSLRHAIGGNCWNWLWVPLGYTMIYSMPRVTSPSPGF